MVFGACKSLIFYNISKKDEIGNCGSNNNVVKIEIYTTCCDIAHRQNIDLFMSLTIGNVKFLLLFYD